MKGIKFPYSCERLAIQHVSKQNKTVDPHIAHLMCYLLLMLTSPSQVGNSLIDGVENEDGGASFRDI